jgi:hypothetical protein
LFDLHNTARKIVSAFWGIGDAETNGACLVAPRVSCEPFQQHFFVPATLAGGELLAKVGARQREASLQETDRAKYPIA